MAIAVCGPMRTIPPSPFVSELVPVLSIHVGTMLQRRFRRFVVGGIVRTLFVSE